MRISESTMHRERRRPGSTSPSARTRMARGSVTERAGDSPKCWTGGVRTPPAGAPGTLGTGGERKPRIKELRESRIAQAEMCRTPPGGMLSPKPTAIWSRLHEESKELSEKRRELEERGKKEMEERELGPRAAPTDKPRQTHLPEAAAPGAAQGRAGGEGQALGRSRVLRRREFVRPRAVRAKPEHEKDEPDRMHQLYQDSERRRAQREELCRQLEEEELRILAEQSVHNKKATKVRRSTECGEVKEAEELDRMDKLYNDHKRRLAQRQRLCKQLEEEELQMLAEQSVHRKAAKARRSVESEEPSRVELLYKDHHRRLAQREELSKHLEEEELRLLAQQSVHNRKASKDAQRRFEEAAKLCEDDQKRRDRLEAKRKQEIEVTSAPEKPSETVGKRLFEEAKRKQEQKRLREEPEPKPRPPSSPGSPSGPLHLYEDAARREQSLQERQRKQRQAEME
ncbi:unnamed protein product, partial [Effrenium voratum]